MITLVTLKNLYFFKKMYSNHLKKFLKIFLIYFEKYSPNSLKLLYLFFNCFKFSDFEVK